MTLSPKIGLEIHLELATKTKMFCSCLNDSSERHPNINICEICTGQPGTLPVLNKQAVIFALKIIKAINGEIQSPSIFARKNYFYPDLPKNYQISQYETPLGLGGELDIPHTNKKRMIANGGRMFKEIRIRRIHLEEDTARLIHSDSDNSSLIDFNRSGVPLVEIVTEPDIESAEEAKTFVEELILLIRYLKISEANAEKGEIRFEANISVRPNTNEFPLGTKVEVKNLNSIRAMINSIEYEIKRQEQIILAGDKIIQETRGWDDNKKKTFSQRLKEEAEDYRYFPEPDLPPLMICEDILSEVIVPELPVKKRDRFQKEFNLSFQEADLLIKHGFSSNLAEKETNLADFFEEAISELKEILSNPAQMNSNESRIFEKDSRGNIRDEFERVLYNYLVNDLLGLLTKYQKTFEDIGLTPHQFAHLISKVISGEYHSKIVKEILEKVVESAENLEELIKASKKIIDENELEKIIIETIKENPKAVEDYKKGKQNSFEFLIGQVMRKTKGQADIEKIRKILKKKII
jgi:aspartyl-tRNA(Asn)/glutamyl-tRNA(Gln) amidotransferase subunit B